MLLLDTNVLVHAHDSASRNNRRGRRVLKSVLKGKLDADISYQSLIELYAVLMNPLKLEHPCTPREAAELCELYFKSKNLEVPPNAKKL
jgi:predicted nucleic acid-binding protein